MDDLKKRRCRLYDGPSTIGEWGIFQLKLGSASFVGPSDVNK